MPFVHIWNARDCILEVAWRSAAAARRLRPLAVATTIACGAIPPVPPTFAQPPPPPPQTIVVPPPAAWTYPPSPFGYLPPATSGGAWTPVGQIPLGPVLQPPELPRETFAGQPFDVASDERLSDERAPICDTTPPPVSHVPEPPVWPIFFFGLLVLFIWKMIPLDGTHRTREG